VTMGRIQSSEWRLVIGSTWSELALTFLAFFESLTVQFNVVIK